MKKLAFIATGYIKESDGISVYLENILQNLVNMDIILDIYIPSTNKKLLEKRINSSQNKNINFIEINSLGFLRFLELQIKLLKTKYTLIFFANPMPIFFSFGKRVKVIHDLTIKQTPQYFSKKFHLYIDLLIYFMKYFDYKVGYISTQTKDDIKKFYNISENKLVYFPNGIPSKVQKQTRPRDKEIEEKFKTNHLQIIVVGRINRSKGFDRIIKFLDFYEKNNTFEKFTLNIVGKQTDETKQLFKDKRYKNINLNFCGFVDDDRLNTIYKQSHYCLFLSRNEGFGLPLVEALWFKVIPLVSSLPVFKEILKDFKTFDNNTGYDKAILDFIIKSYHDKTIQDEIFKNIETIIKEQKNGYKLSAKNIKELLEKTS